MNTIAQDAVLKSGETLRLVYVIDAVTQQQQAEAVHYVKSQVAKDKRWHYGGGVVEERTDPNTGETYKALVITVQVADPAKIVGTPPDPDKVYEANALGAVVKGGIYVGFALVAIVGAATAIYWSTVAKYAYYERNPGQAALAEFKWPLAAVGVLIAFVLLLRAK